MQSMTGFGRAETEDQGRKLTVEIKSVNHRFLDINIRIPRTLGFAEERVRKTIKSQLGRGRVDVFINYSAADGEAKKVVADISLMRAYIEAAREAAAQTGIADDVALSHMIRVPEIISIEEAPEDEEKLSALVGDTVGSALESLVKMRTTEGAELKESINTYIDALQNACGRIEQRRASIAGEYANKLRLRIAELIADTKIDETRFATEVALMADRADITEEIVRLHAHFGQIKATLKSGEASGRKLDFLVQELNREFNTIGSKSQDSELVSVVIEAKSLVEKIREQVQNIE